MTYANIFWKIWRLYRFCGKNSNYINQKRTAYVRMAIGLRGLERKCLLVCLWARLLDSLIVIPAMTMHNIVNCRLLTKTRYTHKKSGLHPFQKHFLNRKGTIISTYGGRGFGNQKRKRKIVIIQYLQYLYREDSSITSWASSWIAWWLIPITATIA